MSAATRLTLCAFLALPGAMSSLRAQCAEEPPLKNYTGAGTVVCPCFDPDEEAGVVLEAPAEDYPIEILRVGIAWGSQAGVTMPSVEEAIRIYGAGLPNPGSPIFELQGPQLVDGAINEFDLEPSLDDIIIDSGPFAVTLRFFNQNAGNFNAASVVHDGNGCQVGKNLIRLATGQWRDACSLGLTGDWVFYVVYRPVACGGSAGSVPDGADIPGTPLMVTTAGGGQITLTWSASCAPGDDYAIYEGSLGSWASHVPLQCSTSGATMATFTPGTGSTYYLVVPNDGAFEGSYGLDGDGLERLPGSSSCMPAVAPTCP